MTGGFHWYLANVNIPDLEQAVLQSPAAVCVNLITNTRHPVGKSLQAAWIWRRLTAKESLFWHRGKQFLSYESIRLVAEFLNQFMSRSRIKDVVLDGYVLIVELIKQAKWGNRLGAVSKPCLAKFVCKTLLS